MVVNKDLDETYNKLCLGHIIEAVVILALFIAVGNIIETYCWPVALWSHMTAINMHSW